MARVSIVLQHTHTPLGENYCCNLSLVASGNNLPSWLQSSECDKTDSDCSEHVRNVTDGQHAAERMHAELEEKCLRCFPLLCKLRIEIKDYGNQDVCMGNVKWRCAKPRPIDSTLRKEGREKEREHGRLFQQQRNINQIEFNKNEIEMAEDISLLMCSISPRHSISGRDGLVVSATHLCIGASAKLTAASAFVSVLNRSNHVVCHPSVSSNWWQQHSLSAKRANTKYTNK